MICYNFVAINILYFKKNTLKKSKKKTSFTLILKNIKMFFNLNLHPQTILLIKNFILIKGEKYL